jgi:hypothetical protein
MIAKLGYWLDETPRRSKPSWETERDATPAT